MKKDASSAPSSAGSDGQANPQAPAKMKPRRKGRFFSFLGFLSICGLAAGIGYVWTETQKLNSSVSENAGEVDEHLLAQERRNDALDASLSDLKTSMIASEEANRSVADTVTTLSDQIAGLNRAFDERIAQITEDQQMLTQEMNTWAKTTSQQGEAIQVIENQVTLAKQEMEKIAQNAQSRFNALASDLRDQIGRIDSVDTSLGNTDEAVAAMNDFLNELETNYADVHSDLVAVRSGFSEQQTQISDLASALAVVQIELAQVRSATVDDVVATVETSDIPPAESSDEVGEEVADTDDGFANPFAVLVADDTESVVESVSEETDAAADEVVDVVIDSENIVSEDVEVAADLVADPTVRQETGEFFSPFENGSN